MEYILYFLYLVYYLTMFKLMGLDSIECFQYIFRLYFAIAFVSGNFGMYVMRYPPDFEPKPIEEGLPVDLQEFDAMKRESVYEILKWMVIIRVTFGYLAIIYCTFIFFTWNLVYQLNGRAYADEILRSAEEMPLIGYLVSKNYWSGNG